MQEFPRMVKNCLVSLSDQFYKHKNNGVLPTAIHLKPFQSIPSLYVSTESKKALEDLHLTLDPFKLKRQIDRQLKDIFRMVKVTSNVRKRI